MATDRVILAAGKKRGLLRDLAAQKYLLAMAVPAVTLVILFHYLPIYGIVLAFKDYRIGRGILGSPWVGLRWFELFFDSPYMGRLLKNTFLLGLYSLLWTFPAPILLALLLNEIGNGAYKKVVQTISYLPHFISTVIIVGLLKEILSLHGIVNDLIAGVGLEPVHFFARPGWFRTIFIGSGVWQTVGWNSIIFLAALSGVDPELYEASLVDGANRVQRMIHVSVASILPTIIILFILSLGGILNTDFQKILLMYNPNTYETADVIDTYVYREGIVDARYSYGAAVGLFKSVIAFAFVFAANQISRKVSDTSLW